MGVSGVLRKLVSCFLRVFSPAKLFSTRNCCALHLHGFTFCSTILTGPLEASSPSLQQSMIIVSTQYRGFNRSFCWNVVHYHFERRAVTCKAGCEAVVQAEKFALSKMQIQDCSRTCNREITRGMNKTATKLGWWLEAGARQWERLGLSMLWKCAMGLCYAMPAGMERKECLT